MDSQRERARTARQDGESMKVQGGPLSDFTTKSEFVGYNELVTTVQIIAIIRNQQLVDAVKAGEACQVIMDRTPFYAESGGQVSDHGWLTGANVKAAVAEVGKAPQGQFVHSVMIESGELRTGDQVEAEVDRPLREDIIKNHTATHLLHRALKDVLGEHVNQAGSLVSPDRLRFDFSHFGGISPEELQEIELRVNQQIWQSTELNISLQPIAEAKALGAMALFGEKYGDIVRVVRVGNYSVELCGGCHVTTTAQIGLFKIAGESGIGSGVRRIEAFTGRHAYEYMEQQLELLKQSAALLKTNIAEVPKRVDGLLGQLKDLSRENESLRGKLSHVEAGQLTEQIKTVAGITLLTAQVDAGDMDSLRIIVDELKAKLESAIIVLGAVSDDKVNLVAAVTPDLIAKGFHAGKIIKEAASRCGGSGGGRPDLAQAGGKEPSKLKEALQSVEDMIAAHVIA
jgi:alanyl-tRNA synthetase